MERASAIKKLGALLGKNFGYQVDSHAPSADERVAAKEMLKPQTAKCSELERRMNDRRNEILNADATFQKLKTEYTEAREEREKLSSLMGQYKITVGTSTNLFFMVKARGDTWEEVIRKVQQTGDSK
jgi:hypothetical protein